MRRLAGLLLLVLPVQVWALGDSEVQCGNLTRGDIIQSDIRIICGMSPAEFADNMRLALSSDDGDHAELFRRLGELLPEGQAVQAASIRRFFEILGEADVPVEQLQDRMAEIALRHQQLLDEIRTFRVSDPEVQALREAAAGQLAADPPNHDAARASLDAARILVREKREVAAKLLVDQQREEAGLVREQAGLEVSRLRRLDAARLYETAAALLPDGDREARWQNLSEASHQFCITGRDRGDNRALTESIRTGEFALTLADRSGQADDWAATQNNLGIAYQTLGERESGTARLEQAVAVYRAALEEWTRDRVPLNWAATQNNLGNALQTLGARESGTVRLEQAVAAYRAALEERTREGAPLDWAYSHHGMAHAKETLFDRTSEAAVLREAIDDMEKAREVYELGGDSYRLAVAEESLARMRGKLPEE